MSTNAAHTRPALIVYFDLGIGGVQRKIVDIVNACAKKQPGRPIYILLDFRAKTTLVPAMRHPNVHVCRKPLARLPFWVFILWYLVRFDPTTVLSFLVGPSSQAATALAAYFWKRVNFFIGQDVVTSDAYERGDFSKSVNADIPNIFSRANGIFVPARTIMDDLIGKYRVPKHSMRLVRNWTAAQTAQRNKPRYDCIYVGRFDTEKRIGRILDAIISLKPHVERISLVLVGEGKQLPQIRHAIRNNNITGNVRIVPPTVKPSLWLNQARIAVIASESEGAPMFILEAMAARLPVVALGYPGAADIITDNATGFVCRSQNVFTDAIRLLLTDEAKRRRMGQRAYQTVRSEFSLANIEPYLNAVLGL